MIQEEKNRLRNEFYKVMEYSEPFGNEYHDELFNWFITKMEEKDAEIKLNRLYYKTLDTTSQAIIKESEEKLKSITDVDSIWRKYRYETNEEDAWEFSRWLIKHYKTLK